MKVRELIEQLEGIPPEWEVALEVKLEAVMREPRGRGTRARGLRRVKAFKTLMRGSSLPVRRKKRKPVADKAGGDRLHEDAAGARSG